MRIWICGIAEIMGNRREVVLKLYSFFLPLCVNIGYTEEIICIKPRRKLNMMR